MEKAVPEVTKHGIIDGRDALFLHKIAMPNERQLVLTGDINTYGGVDERYEIKFNNTLYVSSTELDFLCAPEAEEAGNFCVIENSKLIKKFKKLDHSKKLSDSHRHFYFCTYDTVFQVVAADYEFESFSAL